MKKDNKPSNNIKVKKESPASTKLYRTKQKKSSPTHEQYLNFQKTYDYFNQNMFANSLPNCLLSFYRSFRSSGCFVNNIWKNGNRISSQISLSSVILGEEPIEVLSTLVHEMCHLWQYRYGNPSRSGYHNKGFAEKMESVGLITSTTGKEGGKRTGQNMSDYVKEGGKFEHVFNSMPKEYLMPWVENTLFIFKPGSNGTIIKPRNRNKTKYFCPNCGVNAWGRPDLSLICGNCKIKFLSI